MIVGDVPLREAPLEVTDRRLPLVSLSRAAFGPSYFMRAAVRKIVAF